MKKLLLRVAIGVVASGAAIATTAGVVSAAPAGDSGNIVEAKPAASSSAESGTPRACLAEPDPGWVLFYDGFDCQGEDYQGWAACGWHDFTGGMYQDATSYKDNQIGADADVYNGATFLFNTTADNRVHNLEASNNKATRAHLNC